MLNKKKSAELSEALEASLEVKGRSLWQDAWLRFRRNKAALTSCIVLTFILMFVLFVPSFAPYAFDETVWESIQISPDWELSHYFGTDNLGRDLFARVAMGGRMSLMVGIAGALVAVIIGTLYGAISGFIGGMVDTVMMRCLEILNAFPFMFFVILMVTLFGRNIVFIFVAIGMVSWLDVARIVRGQTMSLKHKEFIEAARITGVSNWDIVVRHIVPNVIGVVVVYASLLVPSMILFESFLSFLGLGVQEPMTSWGALLQEGAQNMQVAWWQLFFPTVFLVMTLFCFNFIGDGLRDALDPKDRS